MHARRRLDIPARRRTMHQRGGEPEIVFGASDLASGRMLLPIGMDGLAPGNRMVVGDFDDEFRADGRRQSRRLRRPRGVIRRFLASRGALD